MTHHTLVLAAALALVGCDALGPASDREKNGVPSFPVETTLPGFVDTPSRMKTGQSCTLHVRANSPVVDWRATDGFAVYPVDETRVKVVAEGPHEHRGAAYAVTEAGTVLSTSLRIHDDAVDC